MAIIQNLDQTNHKNGNNNIRMVSESNRKRTFSDCFQQLTKMTEQQLKGLSICPDGEFHRTASGKDALDVVNHIRGSLISVGFDCYALRNYVWVVPFIHDSLHLPDFERAKGVLPDIKRELLEETFTEQSVCDLRKLKFIKLNKKQWISVAIISVLIILVI